MRRWGGGALVASCVWASTAVADDVDVWSLRALPGAAEDRLSAQARARGATGERALPACARTAPELVLCVMSRRLSGQVAMVDELAAAGLSTDQAIALAAENAKLAEEEIAYLRRQLIIGGSTLDSVLTAEARLYEAQSKEILFIAEKRKAELAIVAALGLLSSALGL